MARLFEPTNEEAAAWTAWVAVRPDNVRRVVERFEPWSLYRMKSTGHRVTIHSFDEHLDGRVTLKVDVTGQFNRILHDRRVFGIDPDDLEPCAWPADPVGALLSQEEVADNIDVLRTTIRPDLFVLDTNGKAVRKQ